MLSDPLHVFHRAEFLWLRIQSDVAKLLFITLIIKNIEVSVHLSVLLSVKSTIDTVVQSSYYHAMIEKCRRGN